MRQSEWQNRLQDNCGAGQREEHSGTVLSNTLTGYGLELLFCYFRSVSAIVVNR